MCIRIRCRRSADRAGRNRRHEKVRGVVDLPSGAAHAGGEQRNAVPRDYVVWVRKLAPREFGKPQGRTPRHGGELVDALVGKKSVVADDRARL